MKTADLLMNADATIACALLHATAYCDGLALATEANPEAVAAEWRRRSASYRAVLAELRPGATIFSDGWEGGRAAARYMKALHRQAQKKKAKP